MTIRVIDYDWSDSTVATFTSRKGDPLAIRNLSGTVKRVQGGRHHPCLHLQLHHPHADPPRLT